MELVFNSVAEVGTVPIRRSKDESVVIIVYFLTPMSRSSILVVTPRFPLPLMSGTQIREYHSIIALADQFDVHLLSLAQETIKDNDLQKLEKHGVEVNIITHKRTKFGTLLRFPFSSQPYRVTKFENSCFRENFRSMILDINPEIVWVHFLTTMALIPPVDTNVVLDQHNADLNYWDSFASGNLSERIFAYINKRRIMNLQSQVTNNIDIILSVSDSDRRQTLQWRDNTPVLVVPNGIDVGKFTPTEPFQTTGNKVLFVGSLGVRMNEEALKWFAHKSWPDVRDRVPDARFQIVGRSPSSRVKALNNLDGVTVIGGVDSVIEYYDSAKVVIAPFKFGGGTKLKILEALAMKRGLVSTPDGVAGLDLADGKHLLIRERNGEFAAAVADLLADTDERQRLGRNGRKIVRDQYDWDSIMASAIDRVRNHLL